MTNRALWRRKQLIISLMNQRRRRRSQAEVPTLFCGFGLLIEEDILSSKASRSVYCFERVAILGSPRKR